MRSADRWVVWRSTPNPGAKPKKVPYRVTDGGGASVSNPEHWCCYAEAGVAYLCDDYTGLGFVLGGGWSGVDLDDCIDESGNLADWARDIVTELNSYTEVSPSGRGLKVFCKGPLPGGKRGKRAKVGVGAVEMYCEGRYFTVTGQHYASTPTEVNDCSDALTRVYRKYVDPPANQQVEQVDTYKAMCRRNLEALPDSVAGEQGHDKMFRAVCEIRRHGLDGEDAWELIHWFNDNKCEPSWTHDELRHKWDGACKEVPVASPEVVAAGVVAPFELDLVTDRQFAVADYQQSFLVDQCVVVGEHLMIGGPHKSMKTSIMTDLGVSVAAGVPFLDKFEVPEPQPVIFISGESGGATLQKLADRVRVSKGLEPLENLYWGLRLPNLSLPQHLEALKRDIERTRAKLCVVDPAYLAVLSAANAGAAANVFEMGQVLQGFGTVGVETGCTMCLVHHLAGKPKIGTTPGLNNLAFAGFREWARQWLLLNHYKERRSGRMFLKMAIGGSAGHGGTYALEIDEGRPSDPLVGRKWHVSVEDLDVNEDDVPADQAGSDTLDPTSPEGRVMQAVTDTPGGITRSALKRSLGMSGADVKRAVERLTELGNVTEQPGMAAGQKCDLVFLGGTALF